MATATISGYASDKGGYIRQTDIANASSLSGSISFSGLGSGTDMNSVVDKLVQIEAIQKTRLENWKSSWQAKIDNMTGLSQRLLAIQQGANDLRSETNFMVRQGASSNSGVASVQGVNGDAVMGAYNVTVGGGDANPIKHIMRSVGFSDSNSVISGSGGTLTLSINNKDYNITVGANATLNDLMNAINSDPSVLADGALSARIENDGTGSRAYHLVLTSGTGGSAGKIEVKQNPTWMSFDSSNMILSGNNMGGGAVEVSLSGVFTGDKANGAFAVYTATADTTSDVSFGGIIGTDPFNLDVTVQWYNQDGSPSGSSFNFIVPVPGNYVPGQSIDLGAEGISIQLGPGTLADGESVSVTAFANNIDEAEEGTNWSGPGIHTSGNYLGSVNKTYEFTVQDSGDIGGGALKISWRDNAGKSGVLVVGAANTAVEVEKGVMLSFEPGDLKRGDRFSVDVFALDQQQAQDKGLAQAAKVVHDGFSDYDVTPVTSASGSVFSYTYGGTKVDVDVFPGYTLSQLVQAINEDADNPGVQATMVNDGLGLPNSWKLVLSGKNSGAEYQITNISHNFKDSNGVSTFSNGGEVGGGFSVSQLATNSMIKVDGYPSGDNFMQRPYNQMADAITGVNLNLTGIGSSTITISVDSQGIYDKIEAFINAVNMCQTYINDATKFESSENSDDGVMSAGILIGNYSYYMIKGDISKVLTARAIGPVAGQDPYLVLADIGIESDPETGAWNIDSGKLKQAISSNAEAVAKLFIQTPPDETDASKITNYGVGKDAYDLIGRLTAAPSTTKDPVTGKDVTSPGGPLNVLISNYNDIIAKIDDRISYEERRISLYETRMRQRFARLETRLSELNGQSERLSAAIDQLPSNSKK
ncbi:MAG: flagellar filament capping protein FliD [Desulfarculales bacterium]|nr:flagellar filament capping protein FliD [Desulfarculales bacterium]